MRDLPIVVAAYNRPDSLKRLLCSLNNAEYDRRVRLYISIDGGGPDEVRKVADDFEWKFGDKKVIIHQNNIGLRQHILSCGNISQQHDGVIVLEDDLFVSPVFYYYAVQAFEYYQDDDTISGISLYSHQYNETAKEKFSPLKDDSDVYFLQLASSWGQCWSRKQWKDFSEWYERNSNLVFGYELNLPSDVFRWPSTSWKKYFIKYNIEKSKFFVYPYNSLTTNFCEVGQHYKAQTDLLQVSLQFGKKKFSFSSAQVSLIKYDAHCEILSSTLKVLNDNLSRYDFDVDLYGSKMIESLDEKNSYILTRKKTYQHRISFGKFMVPHEVNIITDAEGIEFVLALKSDCIGLLRNSEYFLCREAIQKNNSLDAEKKMLLSEVANLKQLLSGLQSENLLLKQDVASLSLRLDRLYHCYPYKIGKLIVKPVELMFKK